MSLRAIFIVSFFGLLFSLAEVGTFGPKTSALLDQLLFTKTSTSTPLKLSIPIGSMAPTTPSYSSGDKSARAPTKFAAAASSTAGRITAFNPVNNTRGVSIDGVDYYVETPNKPWSLTKPDNHTLRFELRPGELWDGASSRAEIAGPTFPEGSILNVSYNLTVEPGPPNVPALYWRIMGQLHGDDATTGQPPFSFGFDGEKLYILVLSGSSASPTQHVLYAPTTDIQRGHTYAVQIQIGYSNTSAGYLNIWLDGEKIVNYSGPVGYGGIGYWKEGIYQGRSTEADITTTIAVDYSNTMVTIAAPPDITPTHRVR